MTARDGEIGCDHHDSKWGRCTACGMTWSQQAQAMDLRTQALSAMGDAEDLDEVIAHLDMSHIGGTR